MNDYLTALLIILFVILLLGADDILDALLSGRRKPRPKPAARPCKHDWQVSYTLGRADLTPSGVVCSKCRQQRPLGTGGKQDRRKDGKKKGMGVKLW